MVQQLVPPLPNAAITIQPLATPVGSQDSTPPVLQGVPNGTLLEGFVVNRDAQQNPILRTSIGDILVKSEIFLKTGSEVVIRVDTHADSKARIISIDGLTPQDYVSKGTPAPVAGDEILDSSLLTHTAPAPGPSQQGTAAQRPIILTALLLSPNVIVTDGMPPEMAQQWTNLMTSLQKEATLVMKIVKTELPLPSEPITPAPVAPAATTTVQTPNTMPAASRAEAAVIAQNLQAAQPNLTAAPQPQSATALAQQAPMQTHVVVQQTMATPSTAAPVATQIPAQVTVPQTHQPIEHPAATQIVRPNIAAPFAATVQPQTNITAQAPQMAAYVIGHEYDGGSIVQTPMGTFKLLTAQPLPTGSKLTIEVMPETRPALPPLTSAPLLPTDLDELTSLARDWTSLREAITTIAAQEPQLAAQIIQNAIPKPHQKLTSEILFLFAAIKSGSPDQWFGKRAIEVLDMRSPEILKRLRGDFAQLQQVFTDALPQWTSVIVPFYAESQLQQMRMFFKQDEDEGNKQQGGNGQRFVIELDLSYLGDMQFDGFVKKADRGSKHFDLIVRSARHLPTEVEQNIRTIFDNSLQIAGFRGYVNFQQGVQHFVRPLEDVKEALIANPNAIIA